MRNLILQIHLYGGLICASYLILFGVSSLNYNHHPAFTEPGTEKVVLRCLLWVRGINPR